MAPRRKLRYLLQYVLSGIPPILQGVIKSTLGRNDSSLTELRRVLLDLGESLRQFYNGSGGSRDSHQPQMQREREPTSTREQGTTRSHSTQPRPVWRNEHAPRSHREEHAPRSNREGSKESSTPQKTPIWTNTMSTNRRRQRMMTMQTQHLLRMLWENPEGRRGFVKNRRHRIRLCTRDPRELRGETFDREHRTPPFAVNGMLTTTCHLRRRQHLLTIFRRCVSTTRPRPTSKSPLRALRRLYRHFARIETRPCQLITLRGVSGNTAITRCYSQALRQPQRGVKDHIRE